MNIQEGCDSFSLFSFWFPFFLFFSSQPSHPSICTTLPPPGSGCTRKKRASSKICSVISLMTTQELSIRNVIRIMPNFIQPTFPHIASSSIKWTLLPAQPHPLWFNTTNRIERPNARSEILHWTPRTLQTIYSSSCWRRRTTQNSTVKSFTNSSEDLSWSISLIHLVAAQHHLVGSLSSKISSLRPPQ